MQRFFTGIITIAYSHYASKFQCSNLKTSLVLQIDTIFSYLYGINCILLLVYMESCLPVFYIYR